MLRLYKSSRMLSYETKLKLLSQVYIKTSHWLYGFKQEEIDSE